jgi:TetR/AcrR family transcriptional regulator, mexJK operon transcriptional repressor
MVSALEERKRVKRATIRDAARQLFLEHGYAGTSMDAVTTAAGVSKQTVYVYYPSKRVLFADVLEHASVAHPEFDALGYLRGAGPRSRIELQEVLTEFSVRVLHTMLQPDYLALLRVLIPEVRAQPELSELFHETVARQSLQLLGSVFDDAARRGIIAPVDRDAAARLLLGPLLTYLVLDGLLPLGEQVHLPDPGRMHTLVALAMEALPPPCG